MWQNKHLWAKYIWNISHFISKCSMKWWQRDKSKQNYFTSMTYELWSFLNLPWLWYFYRVINIRKTWYSSEFEKEPKSRVADSIMPATLNASSQWLPRPPLIVSKVPLDALRQTSFRLYLPFVAMHWQPEKKKNDKFWINYRLSLRSGGFTFDGGAAGGGESAVRFLAGWFELTGTGGWGTLIATGFSFSQPSGTYF